MVFYADKFGILAREGHTKPATSYTDPEGNFNEEKLHLRDLGVEMSSDLTCNLHIENIVAGANKVVGSTC